MSTNTFADLLEAKYRLLNLIDSILGNKFTVYVFKLIPHLSNKCEVLERQYQTLLNHSTDSTTRNNLHRLICSVSIHGNLDSHSLMEACISIQAAKAQNILNVKRLQNKTSSVGDGRVIPKLEASRLYKNDQIIWARVVLADGTNPANLSLTLNAMKWIPIASNVVEFQWPFKKRNCTALESLLENVNVEKIIFFSDLAFVSDICTDQYVVWSNLLSFYYCYTNDSVDIHVESDHDWERLISMAILTRLFLSKPNLRLFGGNDTPITCMSGYNPYRSLRKLSTQQASSNLPIQGMEIDEQHTPFDQRVMHPVYELSSNRDLQSVTGKSSIGGLNGTELILHNIH